MFRPRISPSDKIVFVIVIFFVLALIILIACAGTGQAQDANITLPVPELERMLAMQNRGSVTKPILESYQRWLWRYRKKNGKPLGISTQRSKLGAVTPWGT